MQIKLSNIFWILLVFSSLCIGSPSATTPADNYGVLFEQVQLLRVFPDGKTFVDAIPKRPINIILKEFNEQNPTSADDLLKFVNANFTIPTERLPLREHIQNLWPQLERIDKAIPSGSTAIHLPEKYIVPGGRFREMYYWDSYFTMLGLIEDGKQEIVESMLRNFESLIARFGHIPNGTRTYYISRSQPPFFSFMVKLSRSTDNAILKQQLTSLKLEYDYWMKGKDCIRSNASACERVVKMVDGSLLNRYWDARDTPRDESFAEDYETALKSNRPKNIVYRDLRAGAESGWDFSSRWLNDPSKLESIHTTEIVPIDLNSLLWAHEKTIASLCKKLSDSSCESHYTQSSEKRARAIRKYLWLPKEKRFGDFDFVKNHPTGILSAATLYPLFVGLASQKEADAVAATTENKLLALGGLRTSLIDTNQQWDKPNGWAPLQWIAVSGLAAYSKDDLAKDIARRWLKTVSVTYAETGKMLEKYDVEERLPGGGGEYPLQDGFGWTNGVVSALLSRYPQLDTK